VHSTDPKTQHLKKTFSKPDYVEWGYIIGKGGCTLKEVQDECQVALQVDNANANVIIHSKSTEGTVFFDSLESSF
jgi:hypothetical protein